MYRLEWYLDQIDRGKPISRRAFLAQLKCSGHSTRLALQTFRFGAKDLSRVETLDQKVFEQLRKLHPSLSNPNSRWEAAIGGRSHDVAVDAAMIVSRNLQNPHPIVIVNSAADSRAPRSINAQALIVENLQNFLHLESTLQFAAVHAGLEPELVEVIWSNGNAINNQHNIPFLASFEKTWWLVDCDAGGLQILANAARCLPKEQWHIVIPDDLEQRLIDHGAPLLDREREKVFKLASGCPQLAPLAEKIMRLQRQLEQETYLISREDN